MSKTLMLWPDKNGDFPSLLGKYYHDLVNVDSLYDEADLFTRTARKLKSILNMSTLSYCSSWVNMLDKFDTIIIHANIINKTIPKYLRMKGYTGRIIYWFWNPVSSTFVPDSSLKKYCEVWSFDINDCKKFKLKYNDTYFFNRSFASWIPNKNLTHNKSACFIGQDKGREQIVKSLKHRLNKFDVDCNFKMLGAKSPSMSCNNLIPYLDYIKIVERNDIIVDIYQYGQAGFSLRYSECIFFQKKIITNNHEYLRLPWFDESNIYIINCESDNDENLSNFLKVPFKDSEKLSHARHEIDFASWLDRF